MSNAFLYCRSLSNVPIDLFSKCPNIIKSDDAFESTKFSKEKQNEILSNIGSYYKNK